MSSKRSSELYNLLGPLIKHKSNLLQRKLAALTDHIHKEALASDMFSMAQNFKDWMPDNVVHAPLSSSSSTSSHFNLL